MGTSKLLITGGTGFIGKHLTAELDRRKAPYAVFSKAQCDLTDRGATLAMFEKHADAEAIVHLACYQAAADFPAKHTADQFDVNSRIHLNVLEGWRRYLPTARLVGIGSACAYPSTEGAIPETRLMDGLIDGSVWSYGFTKRFLATGIRAMNDQHKLNGTFVIPVTMFGEYDDFQIATGHFIAAMIGKFVGAVIENRPTVEIWGDGSQVRDFMDVKAFVEALLRIVPVCERDVVNVGPGEGMSIRKLALMIAEISGFQGQIVFKPTAYVGMHTRTIDVTRMNERYGVRIDPDPSAGIRRTVAWYRANYAEWSRRVKFA
jgi:GDP-L-fucose synthase